MTYQQEPHIVRDFVVSGTHIKIADNYCRDRSSEDVAQILREIARTAQAHLSAAAINNAQDAIAQ